MALQEVLTKYGFEFDGAKVQAIINGTKRAEQNLERTATAVTGINAGMSKAFNYAKTAIGAYIGVRAIKALTTGYAEQQDAALKSSRAVGVNVEAYQGLAYAASLGGADVEVFNKGLMRQAKLAHDAAGGSKSAQDAFREIGVAWADSSGKLRGNEEILMDMADRFQAMPDGTKKTALAMDIFGKSGTKLITTLNEGSAGIKKLMAEAKRLGIVLSEKDVLAAELFNDEMQRAKTVMLGLRNQIGAYILPLITRAVSAFIKWRAKVAEWWHEGKNAERVMTVLRVAISAVVVATGRMVAIKVAGWLTSLAAYAAKAAIKLRAMGMMAWFAAAKFMIIAALVAALVLAVDDLIAFAQGRDSIIGRLLGNGESAVFLRDILNQIAAAAAELWAALLPIFKELWAAALPLLKQLWNVIKPLLPYIGKAIIGLIVGILYALIYIIKGITWTVRALTVAAKAIARAFSAAWQWIKDAWDSVWDAIYAAGRAIRDFFVGIIDGIKAAWNAVVTWFYELWESIKSGVVTIGKALLAPFIWAAEQVKKAWKAVTEAIKDAYYWAQRTAKKTGTKLFEGLTGRTETVGDLVTLPSGAPPSVSQGAGGRTTFNSAVVGQGAVQVTINGVPDAVAASQSITERINAELTRVIVNASRDLVRAPAGQR